MSRGVRYAHRSSSHIPIVTSIASRLDGRRENVSANVSHCHNTCPVIHQHTRYGWQRKNCENESTWTHITFPVVHATPRHATPRHVTPHVRLRFALTSQHAAACRATRSRPTSPSPVSLSSVPSPVPALVLAALAAGSATFCSQML